VDYERLAGTPDETLGDVGEWLRDHRPDLAWRSLPFGVESSMAPSQERDAQQLEYFRRMLEEHT
jgi:hypothetical protein